MRRVTTIFFGVILGVGLFAVTAKTASADTYYCYCQFRDAAHVNENCRGQMGYAGEAEADSIFSANDACENTCNQKFEKDGQLHADFFAAMASKGICAYTNFECTQTNQASSCQYCFCKYKSNYSQELCRGETIATGLITPSTERCQQMCNERGYESPHLVDVYDTACDIRPGDCRNPADLSWHGCKVCVCQYKNVDKKAAACLGKAFVGKYTSLDSTAACTAICTKLGQEVASPAIVAKTADVCLFDRDNNCAAPWNPASPKCTPFLTEQQRNERAEGVELKRGSASSLPLPFSDISGPALIGRWIRRILSIVGGLALGFFIYGGVTWMTAAGNEERIKRARGAIVWSALGLVATFAAYAIANFVITSIT